MKSKTLFGNLLLMITALIWGCAFVAQSAGMDYVKPITFNGIRCIIAGIVLIPAVFIFDTIKKKNGTYKKMTQSDKKTLLIGGICCGLAVFAATTIQQYGIAQTTVGKAGFISVLYVLIVPFLGLIFKRKPPKLIWFCSFLAIAGLYFLCMNESLSINQGDFVVFIGAIGYAIHIMVVDHFAPKTDGVKLSCLQFIVAGTISFFAMLIVDKPSLSSILDAWLPLLYAGALSGGLGYTLQIIGQKWTEPSVASIIMSLESVFAVIAGAVLLNQIPTAREIFGCVLMFAAIVIIQISENPRKKITEVEA
ncbi:MAG: DMT family transporter [Oscillospiraceae bacterium]